MKLFNRKKKKKKEKFYPPLPSDIEMPDLLRRQDIDYILCLEGKPIIKQTFFEKIFQKFSNLKTAILPAVKCLLYGVRYGILNTELEKIDFKYYNPDRFIISFKYHTIYLEEKKEKERKKQERKNRKPKKKEDDNFIDEIIL